MQIIVFGRLRGEAVFNTGSKSEVSPAIKKTCFFDVMLMSLLLPVTDSVTLSETHDNKSNNCQQRSNWLHTSELRLLLLTATVAATVNVTVTASITATVNLTLAATVTASVTLS